MLCFLYVLLFFFSLIGLFGFLSFIKILRIWQKPVCTPYLLVGLVAVIFIGVYTSFLGSVGDIFDISNISGDSERRGALGTLGDYFGGMLNPILGFLSFIALLVTLHFQSKQLKHTEIQLKQNEIALRDTRETIKQNETALKQNAEALKVNNAELANSNNQLALSSSAHQEMVNTQRYQQVDNLFFTLLGHLTNKLENLTDSMSVEVDSLHQQLFYSRDGLFDFQIVKAIDKSSDIKILFEYLFDFINNLKFSLIRNNIDDKFFLNKYIGIIKNLIPVQIKHLLLFRFSINEREENEKYRIILEELNFFNNLSLYDGDIKLTARLLHYSTFYHESAFLDNKDYQSFRESIFFNFFKEDLDLTKLIYNSSGNVKQVNQEKELINIPLGNMHMISLRGWNDKMNHFNDIYIDDKIAHNFDISNRYIFVQTDLGTFILEFIVDESGNLKYIP